MAEKKSNPWNTYTRTYRAEHPDKVRMWRLTAIANELRKAGYIVIAPKEMLLPTDEGQVTDE